MKTSRALLPWSAAAALLLQACGARSGLSIEARAQDGGRNEIETGTGGEQPDASAEAGTLDASAEAGPDARVTDGGEDALDALDDSGSQEASGDACGVTGCQEACTEPARNRCGACSTESSSACGADPLSDRRTCGASSLCGPTVSCESGLNCLAGTCRACVPTPKTDVPEQRALGALVPGDFNRDGKLDLAIGAQLFLGHGDGTFQLPSAVGTDASLQAVLSADFDRDGRLDLLTRSSAGFVALRGLGDGTTFALPDTIPFMNGFDTYAAVATADLDQDGYLDALVLGNDSTNHFSAGLLSFRGEGNGDFQVAGLTGLDNNLRLVDLAAIDFDGDGKPDVAVLYEDSGQNDTFTIRTMHGNGTTTFGLPVHWVTVPSGSADLKTSDFNGDQRLDLVVSGGSEVDVLLSASDGSLSVSARIAAGTVVALDPTVFNAATGDFNGDGHADLAVPTRAGIEVSLGNGDGSFRAPIRSAANGAVSLAPGNFDRDPALDLAVMRSFGMFAALHGNGDGTFQDAPVTIVAGQLPTNLDVADFNGDGHPDFATPAYVAVQLFLGDGSGAFAPGTAFSEGTGSSLPRPYFAASSDLNRDGKLDLIVSYTETAFNGPFPNTIGVALGNGDGTFRTAHHYPTGRSPGPIALGDIDGDCQTDLVVVSDESNDLSVFLGNGDGSLRAATRVGASGARSLALRDFDGDGKLDIAVAGTKGIAWLRGAGDGSFQPAVPVSDGSFTSLAAGDLNADGALDLVAAGDSAKVLLGGNGTFRDATPAGLWGAEAAIGDLNADGVADCVLAAKDGLHVYFGGAAPFANAQVISYSGNGAPLSVALPGFLGVSIVIVDATGDGHDDIVISHLDETIDLINLCAH